MELNHLRLRDLQEKDLHYQSIIQDKEKDIEQLQLQVEIASKSSMEEVNETRQKIQESMKELEAHKAKRLAARNEMIHLAKVPAHPHRLSVSLLFIILPLPW
jgi:hypothetical protein